MKLTIDLKDRKAAGQLLATVRREALAYLDKAEHAETEAARRSYDDRADMLDSVERQITDQLRAEPAALADMPTLDDSFGCDPWDEDNHGTHAASRIRVAHVIDPNEPQPIEGEDSKENQQ